MNENHKNIHSCRECYGLVRSLAMVFFVVLAMLSIFLLVSALNVYQETADNKKYPTISFSGTGEVITTSTIAQLSFTFSELDDNVSEGRSDVAKAVDEVYSSLRKFSVKERDIKTTSYTIYPEYQYIKAIGIRPGRQELRGYRISHTTSIRIRDLDNAGAILDSITGQNPTNVSSLNFTIDEDERKELEELALVMAIEDAKAKAKRIAKESGIDLKDTISINLNDSSGYYPQYARSYSKAFTGEATFDSTPTPIASGEEKITRTVSITYRVKL